MQKQIITLMKTQNQDPNSWVQSLEFNAKDKSQQKKPTSNQIKKNNLDPSSWVQSPPPPERNTEHSAEQAGDLQQAFVRLFG